MKQHLEERQLEMQKSQEELPFKQQVLN